MTKFLATAKGKIIAGAATIAVIAVIIVIIVIANQGYRSIVVDKLNGTTTVTAGSSESEAFEGQSLKSGDNVAVQESSDLTLALDTDKHVFAKENTRFRLEALGAAGKDSRTTIYLEEGSVLSTIDEPLGENESYVVDTPNASMAVRGTVFTVETNSNSTTVSVDKGEVAATDKETGETTIVSAGESKKITMPAKYNDPTALAVEAALETYLNGGELDESHFDEVTSVFIIGKQAVVYLSGNRYGKYGGGGFGYSGDISVTLYSEDRKSNIEIDYRDNKNTITDLECLRNMKSVRNVEIIGCTQLSDYSALEELPELTSLEIRAVNTPDLSQIAKLKTLTYLEFEYTELTDISPLSSLTNLKVICIQSQTLTDISPISDLTKLTSIYIYGVDTSDFSAIGDLKELTLLYLIGSGDDFDISLIAGCSKLKNVELRNFNIKNLSRITELTELNTFALYYTDVTDISPLYEMKNLKSVTLYDTPVSDEDKAALGAALGITVR